MCGDHVNKTECTLFFFFTEVASNSHVHPESHEDSSKESTSSNAACTDHSSAPSDGDQSHELSNLRLENQLLRNEVQSLNQEMASLLQRSKETQEGRALFQFFKIRNLTFKN
jgi:hypothetical protein